MSDDVTTGPAGEKQPSPAVPKSAAAAAARRARRIAGPARPPVAPPPSVPSTEPAEPVIPTEPMAPPLPVTGPERAAPRPARAPRTTSVTRWVPAGILIVAALTMGVLLLTFSHSVWWAKPAAAPAATGKSGSAGKPPANPATAAGNQLRERVLAAAKQCVVATNKYDYRTFDADEAAGLKCTTGVQSKRYKTAMENLIRGQATRIKASQVPQINMAGIESITAGGKQWSIVVYGQLAIHNANVQARTDPFAAVVRMDYMNGKWLMSDVQTLAEPGS